MEGDLAGGWILAPPHDLWQDLNALSIVRREKNPPSVEQQQNMLGVRLQCTVGLLIIRGAFRNSEEGVGMKVVAHNVRDAVWFAGVGGLLVKLCPICCL